MPDNITQSGHYHKSFKLGYSQDPSSGQDDLDDSTFHESSLTPHVVDKAVTTMASPDVPSEHPALSYMPSLPSPIMLRSLHRSERKLIYLSYWEKSCVQALQQTLRRIIVIANEYEPLNQALLALSACNLSRSSPERGISDASFAQVIYRPRSDHLFSSQQYYVNAVGQVATMIHKNAIPPSPSHTLAALVLFCNLELAMGNFAGFDCHAQGISNYIRSQYSAVSSDPLGRELTAAWVQGKNHIWWLRMNFSSFSVQLSQSSLCPPSDISSIIHSIDARRARVTSILCESYRLNAIVLLQLALYEQGRPHISLDKCIAALKLESKKLDDWHSSLSKAELPIEYASDLDLIDQGHIRPLRFKSHGFAMNYAYYVSSRMMQCTGLFYQFQNFQTGEHEKDVIYWMTMLLRIVAGLDKLECVMKNVYSIGASSLLLPCLFRCHTLPFGRWVEKWLYEWDELSIHEEGSFPIIQALEVVRLANKEKAKGNTIYAIALPEDDGGGSGKFASYQSQCVEKIVLMGRKSSGELYYELIPLDIGGLN